MLWLREQKKVALHVACGDITNVTLSGGKLIIRSSDALLVDVLESGRQDIENAIRWQGLELEFVVEKFENTTQKIESDMKKLNNFFGSVEEE